jgi:type IV secretory pathway VirJ component
MRWTHCLLLALAGTTLAQARTDEPPRTVSVATSRGAQDLIVFRPTSAVPDATRPLVLLVSGEGGWRHFDDLLGEGLAATGCIVGGVDARQYFWTPQDDRAQLAADFRAYALALTVAAERKPDAPLVFAGFSFGADLGPWLAGAGGWEGRIRGLLMIGPDVMGSLESRILEILGWQPKDHIFSVEEALRSAGGVPVFFIHGEADGTSAAPALVEKVTAPKRLLTIAGADHHFNGKEDALRDALVEAMRWIEDHAPRP